MSQPSKVTQPVPAVIGGDNVASEAAGLCSVVTPATVGRHYRGGSEGLNMGSFLMTPLIYTMTRTVNQLRVHQHHLVVKVRSLQ